MKSCPQTRCFSAGAVGWFSEGIHSPGMPRLCLQSWGSQGDRGDPVLQSQGDSPGPGEGQRKLLRVGRAARCRGPGAAGQGVCILLTHSSCSPWVGGKG